ncbi:MAG TPA: YndJ family transporter [Acidimicrobiales bacterium]
MLLAGGPVVVVGLGLALIERVLADGTPAALRVARRLQPAGAVAAVASLALDEGRAAGALAAVWCVVCLCVAAGGVAVAWRLWPAWSAERGTGPAPLVAGAAAAGCAYLAVGGVWLVIARLGLHPLDLSADVVRLTAVHFHYAGFALPVLAATGLASVDWYASRVSLVTGSVAAIAGPAVVAAGIATDAAVVRVTGALVMTVAAWSVAFGTFLLSTSTSALVAAAPRGTGVGRAAGRWLLVISSLSPVVPMLLALQWAVAQHSGFPSLGTGEMASTHGLLNGIGFVMAGLAGWVLAGPVPAAAGRPATAPGAAGAGGTGA